MGKGGRWRKGGRGEVGGVRLRDEWLGGIGDGHKVENIHYIVLKNGVYRKYDYKTKLFNCNSQIFLFFLNLKQPIREDGRKEN